MSNGTSRGNIRRVAQPTKKGCGKNESSYEKLWLSFLVVKKFYTPPKVRALLSLRHLVKKWKHIFDEFKIEYL